MNNKLVSLAFALVEKENNDSWGWFLRLVRIHVVGPGRVRVRLEGSEGDRKSVV